jgi:hypothetical protein
MVIILRRGEDGRGHQTCKQANPSFVLHRIGVLG